MLTTVATGRVWDHSHVLGMYAQTGQGFYAPVDMALAPNGIAYVACRGGLALFARITKMHVDHEFIKEIGSQGYGDGQFIWPTGVAVDSEENVYVTDDFLHRIAVFDKDGAFLRNIGSAGNGDGQLKAPAGIKVDKDDNLVVADAQNHRVQVLDKQGRFIRKWGSQGDGNDQLNMPWGLCLDNDGNVLVADWGNRRVQKFTANGEYLATYGGAETGPGELNRPSGVAVDSEGDIYVTDWNADTVNIYDPNDGRFLIGLTGNAREPSPWAKTLIAANPDMIKARRIADLTEEWGFRRPIAVGIDGNDRIYVLENYRHRIQVYDKVKDYTEHALNA